MTQRVGPGGDSTGPGAGQSAAFNARTGRFAPADTNYTYDHLDEYNRMKRMSSHYFDVEAWEKQRQEEQAKKRRDEAEGKGREKITRKDMVSVVFCLWAFSCRTAVLFKVWISFAHTDSRNGLRRRKRSRSTGVKRGCGTRSRLWAVIAHMPLSSINV